MKCPIFLREEVMSILRRGIGTYTETLFRIVLFFSSALDSSFQTFVLVAVDRGARPDLLHRLVELRLERRHVAL